jgi:hypothetical protein
MQILIDVSQNIVFLLMLKNDSPHWSDWSSSDLLPHTPGITAAFFDSRTVNSGLVTVVKKIGCFSICKKVLDRVLTVVSQVSFGISNWHELTYRSSKARDS